MTDTHLQILATVARHSQRRLHHHDGPGRPVTAASAVRRRDLKARATRTRARVAAAQARRRHAQTS